MLASRGVSHEMLIVSHSIMAVIPGALDGMCGRIAGNFASC